ncbi:hypothetical protein LEP1GSC073_2018 [Leptospira noguchii str. Cascata]|nr:hypothetical protein LEP1GSC073_2018 [Leptospira noguchii str. Cascata]
MRSTPRHLQKKHFRLRIENDFHYIFLSTLTVNFILFFWTSFRSRILQKEGKNVLREAIHYF